MITLPIDLPIRASEASQLSDVIFEQAETRRLTEDLRNRIGGRIGNLHLETIAAHPGSLCPDPIHPSAFFLAIDGVRDGIFKPWLLRIADANTPSSALFPKAILIGRMRLANRREIVASVVPFGPADIAHIRTFADEVDRAFLPRPQGTSPSMAINALDDPFAVFRQIHKSGGFNWAATWGTRDAAMCAAIRAGWREGYSAESDPLPCAHREACEFEILHEPGFTKFILQVDPAAAAGETADAIGTLCDFIQKARSPQPTWRKFDVEILYESPTSIPEIETLLTELKEQGRLVQSVAPVLTAETNIPELVAAIKRHSAVLKLHIGPDTPIEFLKEAGEAASGRLQCRLGAGVDAKVVAEALRA